MILEYDRSPGASSDQKIQTLMESVQRAFNNIDAGTLTGNMSTLVRINGGSLFGIIDGDYVFVKNLDADSIKAVNAWVDKLLVQTNLLANDGQVYTLDAIEVNAANITAGTLDVQRIILTIDGQKYMFDPRGHYEKTKDTTIVAGKTYYVRTGTDPDYEYIAVDNPVQVDIGNYYEFLTYEKLDGDVIEDLTITADKIVSGSIMTRHITTQDIEGTSGWINLRNGTFFYGNGVNFATADNAIWWDGNKLKIKADDFLLSSGKSIFDEIDEIETWFYATDPTLSNEPAVNWTTYEARQMHLRDIYYNTDNGYSFRWAILPVDDPTGNPSTQGYLELVDGEYVETTDTTVDPTKEYYTFGWMQLADADLEEALERLSAAETAISQNADSIVSLASANATYTTPSGNTATNALTTKITQTATSIESLAANNATYTKPDGTTGTNAMQSAISQNASNITLKVSKDNVIGEINLSSEAATISADKINIAGTITAINNDSTTTIDGDKITTGTLSASAVDATSGYFDTANIPNLNASKITAGDISADRMSANAISAINADLTSATIDGAHIGNLSASKITSDTIDTARLSASGIITAINAEGSTTIDGDKITTGSISANRIDASSGTFNTANIPNLSASKITSGDIDSARIKASVITAINDNTTTTIDGDKITTGSISANRIDASSGTFNEANIPNLSANKIDVLTKDGTSGVYLHPSGQSPSSSAPGNSVSISGNGMKVYKGGTLVASYGDSAQIGKTTSGYTTIQGAGMKVYGNDGSTELANIGYGSGKSEGGSTDTAPYYTFGERKSGSTVGNYSVAEGKNIEASAFASHAEGRNTKASDDAAHAEGYSTTASNLSAHSEGYETTASGFAAHAQNYNTIAASQFQTAIGQWNVADSANTYAFIIGTGVGNSSRKNGFTVDWYANVDAKGDVNIASGKHYKINGTNLSATDVGAVPTTRTVNSKALSSDITLAPSDLGLVDYITSKGKSGDWYYEKWNSGKVEAWGTVTKSSITYSASGNLYRSTDLSLAIPSGIFSATPTFAEAFIHSSSTVIVNVMVTPVSGTSLTAQVWKVNSTSNACTFQLHCVYYPSSY